MHFRLNSAKIYPKYLKLFIISFLTVRGIIAIEGPASSLATPLIGSSPRLKVWISIND